MQRFLIASDILLYSPSRGWLMVSSQLPSAGVHGVECLQPAAWSREPQLWSRTESLEGAKGGWMKYVLLQQSHLF